MLFNLSDDIQSVKLHKGSTEVFWIRLQKHKTTHNDDNNKKQKSQITYWKRRTFKRRKGKKATMLTPKVLFKDTDWQFCTLPKEFQQLEQFPQIDSPIQQNYPHGVKFF